MRSPRHTRDEGPGSPTPGCLSDRTVSGSWAGLAPWGSIKQGGRPSTGSHWGEYIPIRPHSQDLGRNLTQF